MGKIILGLIVAGIGMLISIKSRAFHAFFGPIPIADKIFNRGSHTGYKFLGIIIFFVGIFIMTNIMESILMAVFGRMVGV